MSEEIKISKQAQTNKPKYNNQTWKPSTKIIRHQPKPKKDNPVKGFIWILQFLQTCKKQPNFKNPIKRQNNKQVIGKNKKSMFYYLVNRIYNITFACGPITNLPSWALVVLPSFHSLMYCSRIANQKKKKKETQKKEKWQRRKRKGIEGVLLKVKEHWNSDFFYEGKWEWWWGDWGWVIKGHLWGGVVVWPTTIAGGGGGGGDWMTHSSHCRETRVYPL